MLQAGSPLGPVCSVQASAFRKSASCACIVCVLACYRVVLVCLYWGGLGYGQCMLRTLPGCCINMLDSLARALFVQASTCCEQVFFAHPPALQRLWRQALARLSGCVLRLKSELLRHIAAVIVTTSSAEGGVACCRQELRWDLSAVCRHHNAFCYCQNHCDQGISLFVFLILV